MQAKLHRISGSEVAQEETKSEDPIAVDPEVGQSQPDLPAEKSFFTKLDDYTSEFMKDKWNQYAVLGSALFFFILFLVFVILFATKKPGVADSKANRNSIGSPAAPTPSPPPAAPVPAAAAPVAPTGPASAPVVPAGQALPEEVPSPAVPALPQNSAEDADKKGEGEEDAEQTCENDVEQMREKIEETNKKMPRKKTKMKWVVKVKASEEEAEKTGEEDAEQTRGKMPTKRTKKRNRRKRKRKKWVRKAKASEEGEQGGANGE